MDSLPPRKEESLKKQYESQREGRTTHSTLREQVTYPPPKEMWHTPTAVGHSEQWEKRYPGGKERKHPIPNLAAEVKIGTPYSELSKKELWPTPSVCGNYNRKGLSPTSGDGLATKVKMYPTPQNRGYKGKSQRANFQEDNRDALPNVCGENTLPNKSLRLSPDWVEWLMNFPEGWTDLACENVKPFSGNEVDPADEGRIPRVASGVDKRVDRLKCLGNAVCPPQCNKAWKILSGDFGG